MAILWMDGFDHYGLDTFANGQAATGRMLDGVYAQVDPALSLDGYGVQAANSRTGGRAYRDWGLSGIGNRTRIRRVFGGAKIEVGVGFALYMEDLPGVSDVFAFNFRDVNNVDLVTFTQDTTGVIRIKAGDETDATVGDSGTPALVADAWQHIEMFVGIDDVYGYAEIRVKSQTVATAVDVDFGIVGAAQFAIACDQSTGLPVWLIDDLFAWDTVGAYNNDFLGDLRVRTLFPDEDTTQADWTPTGPGAPPLGHEMIDEDTPDDATSYIECATPTPPAEVVSDFALDDTSPETSAIIGCQTYLRMRKTQAGGCNIQTGMLSAAAEDLGSDRAITEAWTYWMDVFEVDPDTGALWTKTALDAAELRIKRTL